MAACALIGVAFFFLSMAPINAPSGLIFDEWAYIPAARELNHGSVVLNREHPILGKFLIGWSIALFGDNTVGWRFASVVMMPAAIVAGARAFWWFTRDMRATILFAFFLATSCQLNVLGRLGTLDAPMLFFGALAAYFFARDRRGHSPAYAASAGCALGLALACKWAIAPLLPWIALAWLVERGFTARSVVAAGLWFGVVPLCVYTLTFVPGMLVADNPIRPKELLALQLAMASALSGYSTPNLYASVWWEWILNIAPFWLHADQSAEGWRFLVLTNNPVSAFLVIPALAASAWLVVSRRETGLVWALGIYAIPLLLAASSDRNQFIHHYAMSYAVGLALLAIMLSRAWSGGTRWPAIGAVLGSGLAFAWLLPALTAAPLARESAGQRFILLPGWEIQDWKSWAPLHKAEPPPEWRALQECLDHPLQPQCPGHP